MWGRLLDGLKQSIKGLGRQVVDFVDNEDLVARGGRPVFGDVDNGFAHLLDSRLARGVHLIDVHAVSGCDGNADVAGVVGFGGWSAFTAQSLG